jgi:hypothetical protein
MDEKLREIQIGDRIFIDEGTEAFGAVRGLAPAGRDEIVAYIENAGDFRVPAHAVRSVHDAKVILDSSQLGAQILNAMAHAHDSEIRGL